MLFDDNDIRQVVSKMTREGGGWIEAEGEGNVYTIVRETVKKWTGVFVAYICLVCLGFK